MEGKDGNHVTALLAPNIEFNAYARRMSPGMSFTHRYMLNT